MSKQVKLIRGQIRQVVQELLQEEMSKAAYQEVLRAMHERINKIENNVKETLNLVDKRSKDIAGYLVRQSSLPTPPGSNIIPAPDKKS